MKFKNIETRTAVIPDDLETVKKLWSDYLVWNNNTMQELYGINPHDPEKTVETDILYINKFQPPFGSLIVAIYEDKICGVGCLKSINSEIGEIKRMFIDPSFRQIGAGQAVLERLLNEAKNIGYKRIRLDSLNLWMPLIHYIDVLVFETLKRIQRWKLQQNLKTIWYLWNWILRHKTTNKIRFQE